MATRLLASQCARLQLRFRNFQIKLTCFHLRRRKANANASAKRRSIHFRALTSCQDVGMFCRLLLLLHIFHTFFFVQFVCGIHFCCYISVHFLWVTQNLHRRRRLHQMRIPENTPGHQDVPLGYIFVGALSFADRCRRWGCRKNDFY